MLIKVIVLLQYLNWVPFELNKHCKHVLLSAYKLAISLSCDLNSKQNSSLIRGIIFLNYVNYLNYTKLLKKNKNYFLFQVHLTLK